MYLSLILQYFSDSVHLLVPADRKTREFDTSKSKKYRKAFK